MCPFTDCIFNRAWHISHWNLLLGAPILDPWHLWVRSPKSLWNILLHWEQINDLLTHFDPVCHHFFAWHLLNLVVIRSFSMQRLENFSNGLEVEILEEFPDLLSSRRQCWSSEGGDGDRLLSLPSWWDLEFPLLEVDVSDRIKVRLIDMRLIDWLRLKTIHLWWSLPEVDTLLEVDISQELRDLEGGNLGYEASAKDRTWDILMLAKAFFTCILFLKKSTDNKMHTLLVKITSIHWDTWTLSVQETSNVVRWTKGKFQKQTLMNRRNF